MDANVSPEETAIAALLKAQMAVRGISQVQVSRATGISKSQLSRKLAGTRPLEFEDIRAICKATGADLQDILVRGITMAGTTDPENFSVVDHEGV